MTITAYPHDLPTPQSQPNQNYLTVAAMAAGMTAQLLSTAWTSTATQVEPNLYTFPKSLAPIVDLETLPENVTNFKLYEQDMHGLPWQQDEFVDESEVIYSPDPRQTVWSPALNGRNILTTIASRPLKSLGHIQPADLETDPIALHIRGEFDTALNYTSMEFNMLAYAEKRKVAGHRDAYIIDELILWNESLTSNQACDYYLSPNNPPKRITMKMKVDEKFMKPDFKPRPY